MHDLSLTDSHPSYFAKIKALGYVLTKVEHDSFMIPPLRPEESWTLKLIDNRWILYVRDTPQISFLPEEALRFLVFRKFPSQTYHALSPAM